MKNMKHSILKKATQLTAFLSFLFTVSFGQLTIVDTGNCLTHTLHATVTGTMPIGTGITGDDVYSGVFPIGFTFNFYGTNYTDLVVGSNGVLNFNTTLAGGYCPWPITAALLGNPSMRNAICGPWCDILISAGGSITRTTTGIAPNRKFAVTWCASRMYGCTAEWTTSQIIIYETTNLAEVHIARKTSCAWNSGRAIVGVQNTAGTLATVPPARDWTPNWTVTTPPEAWRFTPSAGTYTVSSIPYAPLPYATSAIYWYDSTTGAYLGSGPYLTVTPSVPTTYMAAALGCNDTTKAFIRINPTSASPGGIPNIRAYTATNPSECGKCDGSIILRGINPHQIDTVFHSINGIAQPPYVDSAALDSTIVLSNLCGAVYDYIYVKVGDCPSNQVGPITLVTPVLAVSDTAYSHPTICGKYDGWIKLFGLTPLKPFSIAYSKNGVPQPAFTGIVNADSTILMPGVGAGTYSGIAVTIGLCTAPAPTVVLVNPAPYMPSFTYELGLGCNGDSVFVTNTTTPSGFYSYWNYGDGSGIDSTRTWHVYNTHTASPIPYVGTYTITLYYNTTPYRDPACELSRTETVNFDHRIASVFTPEYNKICLGTDVTFNNASISAYSPTYFWEFGDGFNEDGTENPTHTYQYGGVFNVKLTVTDNIGCKSTSTKPVEVVSLELTTNMLDTSVCLRTPMPVIATAVSQPVQPMTYAWTQTPSGSNLDAYDRATVNFFGLGSYTLAVTASTPPFAGFPNGCEKNEYILIKSFPPITFTNLTVSPQVITLGSSIQLNANGATYYKWSPANGTLNNPNINNPIATPTDSVTTYTVYGMTEFGCLDSAQIKVYVDQDVKDFAPSGFTPNGDGKNDVFRLIGMRFHKLVDFRIYNRWGEKVFQTSNIEDGWDGSYKGVPQDLGTYMYEIIVALPNGLNKSYKGNVTLIR